MNTITSQHNTAILQQAQSALRTALTTRHEAEKRLAKLKTTTSPAACGYRATMAEQEQIAADLRREVEILARQPEATALAAQFGERRLCKYIALRADGNEILDIARINEVRIQFFTIARAGGMTAFAPMCYWFDMPDGSGSVGVEVK